MIETQNDTPKPLNAKEKFLSFARGILDKWRTPEGKPEDLVSITNAPELPIDPKALEKKSVETDFDENFRWNNTIRLLGLTINFLAVDLENKLSTQKNLPNESVVREVIANAKSTFHELQKRPPTNDDAAVQALRKELENIMTHLTNLSKSLKGGNPSEKALDPDAIRSTLPLDEQVQLDKDDLEKINKSMTRETAVEQSGARIAHMFELVSGLMDDESSSKTIQVENNGEKVFIDISNFRKGKSVQESADWADSANVIVKDSEGRVMHDIILQRPHNQDSLSVAYMEHKYSGPDDRNLETVRPRFIINSETGKNQPTFNAEQALDNLPELREIETMLQKAMEAKQSEIVQQ